MKDSKKDKKGKKINLDDVKKFSEKMDKEIEKAGDFLSERADLNKGMKAKIVITAAIVALILFFIYPKTILIILGVFAGLNLSFILEKVTQMKNKKVKKSDSENENEDQEVKVGALEEKDSKKPVSE